MADELKPWEKAASKSTQLKPWEAALEKKNPIQTVSNPSSSNGLTDLNKIVTPTATVPTPLTKQGVQPYEQGIAKQQKDLNTALGAFEQAQGKKAAETVKNIDAIKLKAQEDNKKGGVADSFMSGLSGFNKGIYKIPRYVYELAAVPQNYIAEKLDMPELAASYEAVKKATGDYSPLTVLDKLGDVQDQNEEAYQNRVQKYNEGIVESIGSGNFTDAGSQIANSISQSIPAMLGMAMTSGASNASKLSYIQKTLANALPFASSQNETLRSEDVPDYIRPVSAGLNALAEVIFDQSFGTQAAIENVVKLFQKEGAEVATDAAKELTKGYLGKAMSALGGVKSIAKGSLEEMTTTFAQNLVNKYTVNPEQDLMQGVLDAGIVGGVMTGSVEIGGKALAGRYNKKQKTELTKLSQQRSDIIDDLDKPNIPDEVKSVLNDNLEVIDAKIDGITSEAESEIESLPKEVKDAVVAKQGELDAIENQIESQDITETTKTILEEQKTALEKELNDIIDNPVVNEEIQQEQAVKNLPIEETVSAEQVIPQEEAVPEIVDEGVGNTVGEETGLVAEQIEDIPDAIEESTPVTEEKQVLPTERIQEIQVKRQNIKDRISTKFKEQRGQLSSGFDPSLISDFVELGATYIEEGVVNAQDFIKRFREDYKDLGFDDGDITDEEIKSAIYDTNSVKEEPKESNFKNKIYQSLESNEVKNTLSNIERETGRELDNKEYNVTGLVDAMRQGQDIVDTAKEEYGDTYVKESLDFIKENANSIPIENRVVTLISLANDLEKQIIDNPDNKLTLEKQLKLVNDYAVKLSRSAAIATAMGRLRQIGRVGYDINQVTSEFFSTEQRAKKRKLQKKIEATADDINKEAERIETGEIVIEEPRVRRSQKIVKAEISDVLKKMRADLLKAAKGGTLNSALPFQAQVTAVAPHVVKLSKLLIELGGLKASEIVKEIRNQIKDIAPDVDEKAIRDIINSEKITPEMRLNKLKDNALKRIEQLKQEIADKRKELKVRNKLTPDADLEALIEEEKQLKELAKQYYTAESIDKINEAKEKAIVSKVEKEISALDKQIAAEEKTVKESKTPTESVKVAKLKAEKKAKTDLLNQLDPNPKEFTKQALIDAEYSRTIKVNGEERQILDWKKIAGEEGSIENIQSIVEQALQDKGFSEAKIARMQDAFVAEYNSLRANIIERSLKELERQNTPKEKSTSRSSAERLAELYNLGLFEQQSDTYDYLLNKALGMGEIGQEAFFRAKELAGALSDLYSKKILGYKADEFLIKQAVREINRKIELLLDRVAWSESNSFYKVVTVATEYLNLVQRNKLQSLKQYFDNQISGKQEVIIQKIGDIVSGKTDTKELNAFRKEARAVIRDDINANGGLLYGEVKTPLLSNSQVEAYLNNLSDNQLYHKVLSSITGRTFLEGADSMNKMQLVEKQFVNAMVTVLTDPSNPSRMNKEDALKLVSERLTGQTFEQSKVEAKRIIDEVNLKVGKEVLSTRKENVYRFAMDIVKMNLIEGQAITLDVVKSAYDAAYKSAGLGLGHESNNIVTTMVNATASGIEDATQRAIRNKDWNQAATFKITGIVTRNFLNPFVGGGTNWAVLTLQKQGLDFVSFVLNNINKSKKLDITTKDGLRNLEDNLYRGLRQKTTNARILVGATSSVLLGSIFVASGADDEFDEWLKKNSWAKKYAFTFTPQMFSLIMTYQNGELGEYFKQVVGKKESFDNSIKLYKAIEEFNKGTEPSKAKAWGYLGSAAGANTGTPIIPFRMMRDLDGIYKGITGKPRDEFDFKPVGFWNGYFNYGFIDYIGFKPDRTYNTNIRSFIPEDDTKTLKFLDEKKLNIEANSDKEVVYDNMIRFLSPDKAKVYDKEFSEVVYKEIKSKMDYLGKLDEKELKSEINSIKKLATEKSLKKVGAIKYIDKIERKIKGEDQEFILTPKEIKTLNRYKAEYYNTSTGQAKIKSLNEDNISDTEFRERLNSAAESYAKDRIVEEKTGLKQSEWR